MLATLSHDAESDVKLQAVLDSLTKRGPKAARAVQRSPLEGALVKSTKSSVTLTVKRARDTKGFSDWLDDNIDRLLGDSYRTFKDEAGG